MRTIRVKIVGCALLAMTLGACAAVTGRPPAGGQHELDEEEKAAIDRIGKKVAARIVWSSSRHGNHDLFMMNSDGSGLKQITKGENVDWFPRFSPDGKSILFTRSKKGWVAEKDANRNQKWDIYSMAVGGGEEKLIAKDASWGSWVAQEEIVLARGTKILKKNLATGEETLLVDSEKEADLGGADLQQPELKPDGKFVAITLRGAKRETGVFDLEKRSWTVTGDGCQVTWHPLEERIYWVNPSGNGGSEVFSVPMADGKPTKEFDYDQMRFIDIPGRRSHEYFPKMSSDAKWMVWAATQRGHDHDIADYEIYIWEIGAPAEEATRLTYHSGNDRWPDIYYEPGS